MDNSNHESLQVPGFGNMPLDYELPSEDRFAHGLDEWYQVPGVTIRESAMVRVMNYITEKNDWHIDVFNDDIVKSWQSEAKALCPKLSGEHWPEDVTEREILTQRCWDWCLLELREKAKEFKEKLFVRVLDTGSCVCKSDTIVLSSHANVLKTEL